MSDNPVILYVEDDAKSRKVMQIFLSIRLGLKHVTIFEDSHDFQARVLALTPRPDLIFLDIHVQPLSGFDMLATLRQTPAFATVPIIALTASVMGEEVQRLQEHGFTGCLAKPVDLDRFPAILHQILSGDTVWHITD
jgi:CheY-like chemotaxis protein